MDENTLENYGQYKKLSIQRLLPKLNKLHDERRSKTLIV